MVELSCCIGDMFVVGIHENYGHSGSVGRVSTL